MSKHSFAPALCSVLFAAGWIALEANAQNAAAEAHVATARAAAARPGHDFSFVLDRLCKQIDPADTVDPAARGPLPRRTPPRSDWFREPAKIFDNLYFVGSGGEPGWVVTTSGGIILIDTTDSYAVEEQVGNGFRKLGLNPADIKYILVTAAHTDHYAGAPYLIERYHPRIVMSEADWKVVETSNLPAEIKPKRDIVATDDGHPKPVSGSETSPSVGVRLRWILYRGPGTVRLDPDIMSQRVYGKPATLETKVSFSMPGTYRLRAIASDGQLFSTYDVDVTVR